jgi:hypothetical protein
LVKVSPKRWGGCGGLENDHTATTTNAMNIRPFVFLMLSMASAFAAAEFAATGPVKPSLSQTSFWGRSK